MLFNRKRKYLPHGGESRLDIPLVLQMNKHKLGPKQKSQVKKRGGTLEPMASLVHLRKKTNMEAESGFRLNKFP